MNAADIICIVLIACALIAAIIALKKSKNKDCGCCNGCACCTEQCDKRNK